MKASFVFWLPDYITVFQLRLWSWWGLAQLGRLNLKYLQSPKRPGRGLVLVGPGPGVMTWSWVQLSAYRWAYMWLPSASLNMFSTCLLPLYFKHKNKLHNTNFRKKKKNKLVIIYLGFTCQFALPLITSMCLIKSTMPHYHAVEIERPVPAVFFLTLWTCGQ